MDRGLESPRYATEGLSHGCGLTDDSYTYPPAAYFFTAQTRKLS